jgi:hypothetical protein
MISANLEVIWAMSVEAGELLGPDRAAGVQVSNRAKPGGSEYNLVQIWCNRY